MKYTELTITPEIAKEMLANNRVNRSIRKSSVNRFANDMRKGRWQLNGECISFYEDGSIANGQHRLSAIVKANVPVKMGVITGVPMTSTTQDRGTIRNVVDSMRLDGYDSNVANNYTVAIANLHFYIQKAQGAPSDGDAKDFICRNAEKLTAITEYASAGTHNSFSIRSSCILLACFYAINSGACSLEQIRDFLSVLKSGLPEGKHQNAAVVLRNDLMLKTIPLRGGNVERRPAVYKVEKAISDFCDGYPRKVSYSSWKTPVYSNLKVNVEA